MRLDRDVKSLPCSSMDSPLLDQDFSHNTDRSNEAVRALRLLARLKQPFGPLLFRKVSRVETINASQQTV